MISNEKIVREFLKVFRLNEADLSAGQRGDLEIWRKGARFGYEGHLAEMKETLEWQNLVAHCLKLEQRCMAMEAHCRRLSEENDNQSSVITRMILQSEQYPNLDKSNG